MSTTKTFVDNFCFLSTKIFVDNEGKLSTKILEYSRLLIQMKSNLFSSFLKKCTQKAQSVDHIIIRDEVFARNAGLFVYLTCFKK